MTLSLRDLDEAKDFIIKQILLVLQPRGPLSNEHVKALIPQKRQFKLARQY